MFCIPWCRFKFTQRWFKCVRLKISFRISTLYKMFCSCMNYCLWCMEVWSSLVLFNDREIKKEVKCLSCCFYWILESVSLWCWCRGWIVRSERYSFFGSERYSFFAIGPNIPQQRDANCISSAHVKRCVELNCTPRWLSWTYGQNLSKGFLCWTRGGTDCRHSLWVSWGSSLQTWEQVELLILLCMTCDVTCKGVSCNLLMCHNNNNIHVCTACCMYCNVELFAESLLSVYA